VNGKNKRDGVSTGMGCSIKENYGKRFAVCITAEYVKNEGYVFICDLSLL
jgi:hypothetical protein